MKPRPLKDKALLWIAVSTGIAVGIVILLFPNTVTHINDEESVEIVTTVPIEVAAFRQSAPAVLPPSETSGSVIAAGAYLISNGEPLYVFREEKLWPIASVTKLMTAFVARQLILPTEVIMINEEAVAAFGEAGQFNAGESFQADNLVKAMLVASSNDAAEAVASHYGEEEFVAQMNRVASEIGMSNTSFVDPTGLSSRNLSTAGDLVKLVQAIWAEDPELFAATRLPTVTIVDIGASRGRKLYNTNIFAGRKDFLGGKTGQTPDSDGNLVSIFETSLGPSPVVIIVLGAEDRFKETEKILMKL